MATKTVQLDTTTGRLSAVTVSAASLPPTLVAGDASFSVPEDSQMLTFATCRVDGTLVVTGTLL